MSVNGFSKIDPVDLALSQAGQSNKTGAFKTLATAYALTPDQTASIRRILNTFQPDTFMSGEPALKREIVAILNLGAASQTLEHISVFLNDPTSFFSNDYPCQIGFGGKSYPNATVCLLAQQYTDQPEMMDLLIQCETTEEAVVLASLTPMTEVRKHSWENTNHKHINQCDVMIYVLRAKFRQNLELKKQLLATGNSFIVCQGNDFFLSDNFNGTGKNILGRCLMRVRGECGGTGIVQPDANYLNSVECLQRRCHSMTDKLFPEIVHLIFSQCLSTSDYESLSALACLNNHWNQCSKAFWAGFDLGQFSPELTILDAKAQGIVVDDEPTVSKLAVLEFLKNLRDKVENNEGLTLLTMCKGLTLNEFVKMAAEKGIKIEFAGHRILQELGDKPVLQTYVILITNNVFIKSRSESYAEQKIRVRGNGCEMPTVQEYVALWLFTNTIFSKCLYVRNPLTYGRSSTRVGESPLVIGGSTPAHLYVSLFSFVTANDAAGGSAEVLGSRVFGRRIA